MRLVTHVLTAPMAKCFGLAYSAYMQTTPRLIVALLAAGLPGFAASAQTGPTLMLDPWAENTAAEVSIHGLTQDTQSQQTGLDVDLNLFDVTGRVRLDPGSDYDPALGFSYSHLDLRTADPGLPGELVDMSLALGGRLGDVDLGETLGGQWDMIYTVGLGYAGTAPVNDGEAWYLKANLFAIKPIDKDRSWLVGINYDGNRSFFPDLPLPAVTYFARLTETITYGLGFPVSRLTWAPNDAWKVQVNALVFFSLTASVEYQVSDRLTLFGTYDKRSEAYHLSGDVDNRRLFYSIERVEAGLRYELTDNLDLLVAVGYAIDEEFERGFDQQDTTTVRDLDEAIYVRGGLEMTF